jgi:hypothetical protein
MYIYDIYLNQRGALKLQYNYSITSVLLCVDRLQKIELGICKVRYILFGYRSQ